MREHSDWLRGILGYKSVQIFHFAFILSKTAAHRPNATDNCVLKTWRLPKTYKSLAKMTKILNSGYIYFVAINVKIGQQKL